MSQAKEYAPEEINELEESSKQFHEALFGKAIDENIIVDILINTTNEDVK